MPRGTEWPAPCSGRDSWVAILLQFRLSPSPRRIYLHCSGFEFWATYPSIEPLIGKSIVLELDSAGRTATDCTFRVTTAGWEFTLSASQYLRDEPLGASGREFTFLKLDGNHSSGDTIATHAYPSAPNEVPNDNGLRASIDFSWWGQGFANDKNEVRSAMTFDPAAGGGPFTVFNTFALLGATESTPLGLSDLVPPFP